MAYYGWGDRGKFPAIREATSSDNQQDDDPSATGGCVEQQQRQALDAHAVPVVEPDRDLLSIEHMRPRAVGNRYSSLLE